jgi:Reductase C-terminal
VYRAGQRRSVQVNQPKDILCAKKMIKVRHQPDPGRLRDEETDLRAV